MKRIFLAAAVTLAAALAVALLPGAATGTATSTSATKLSCNDGTNINLALNATALSALTSAVSAMTLYPTGLACSVSQLTSGSTLSLRTSFSSPGTLSSPRTLSSWRTFSSASRGRILSPSGSGNPQHDYAVGGAQQVVPTTPPCRINFGLSAHTLDDMPLEAKGTFNATTSVGGCASLAGQLRVEINCLDVTSATHADMRGTAKRAGTGWFSPFAQGDTVYVSVDDNDGAGFDKIGYSDRPATQGTCGGSFDYPILHGNISVHDA